MFFRGSPIKTAGIFHNIAFGTMQALCPYWPDNDPIDVRDYKYGLFRLIARCDMHGKCTRTVTIENDSFHYPLCPDAEPGWCFFRVAKVEFWFDIFRPKAPASKSLCLPLNDDFQDRQEWRSHQHRFRSRGRESEDRSFVFAERDHVALPVAASRHGAHD